MRVELVAGTSYSYYMIRHEAGSAVAGRSWGSAHSSRQAPQPTRSM